MHLSCRPHTPAHASVFEQAHPCDHKRIIEKLQRKPGAEWFGESGLGDEPSFPYTTGQIPSILSYDPGTPSALLCVSVLGHPVVLRLQPSATLQVRQGCMLYVKSNHTYPQRSPRLSQWPKHICRFDSECSPWNDLPVVSLLPQIAPVAMTWYFGGMGVSLDALKLPLEISQ